jgi:major type 1 subunit fimbrin (pilin)
MKKLGLGLVVLAMSAASTAFAAPAGVITFNGELVDGTCDASVGGGSASSTVDMSQVPAVALAAATDVAGKTPFKITLSGTGCEAAGKIATPYFDFDSAKVNADGRLVNTEVTDPATNVDIQLLTNADAPIDLTKPATTQETSAAVVVDPTTNDFNYSAQYYATDAATAGGVAADISYSIVYK